MEKTEYSRQSVPIACLYSPRKDTRLLDYEPIFCHSQNCRAVLNPYCGINFNTHDWTCVFCNKRNILPNHYKDINNENLVPEIVEANSTIEYLMGRESSFPPVFFIMLDIGFFDEERGITAVEAALTIFENLPKDSMVGFLTFGTNIELYDLSSNVVRKTYLFSGKKEYSTSSLGNLLKIKGKENNVINKFVMKKSISQPLFLEILNDIKSDPFPILNGYRQVRCTGSALSFAYSVLGGIFQDTAVKYFLLTQGPCTFGPGTVASISLKEGIRSYNDILRGKANYQKSATEFYTKLAEQMSASGHSVDILATTLYDIGIYEMRALPDMTGGIIVMAQDFNRSVYLSSCQKNIRSSDGIINSVFNAKLKVQTTSNLTFKGVIGSGCKIENGWRINSLHKEHNIGLIFDGNGNVKPREMGYVQIITHYQRSDRRVVKRVTTFARLFSESKNDVVCGFDQEAAMVFLARIFTLKREPEEEIDLIRRIDRILVKFLRTYSSYQQEYANSVDIPFSMSYFPNFVFFFRRSPLVLCESISPDENAYQRNWLSREGVTNSMKMIVPTLISYHYQGNVSPVEMDIKSLDQESILLFDTFHNVVVWRGAYVAQWIKDKIHEKEEYKFLKDLIYSVENKAKASADQRLPTPQYTVCDQYGSQERLLLSRLNPSVRGQIITDDIDFNTFYNCLCNLIVSSN